MTQTASDTLQSQSTALDTTTPAVDNVDEPRTPIHVPELPEALLNIDATKTNGELTQFMEDEGPPSKKRRVSETATVPRRKPESPPWKKIIAEGPSTFTQDGIRKSGRTNHIPLELQPPSDKRQTRGHVQKTTSARKTGGANGSHPARDVPAVVNGTRKSITANSIGAQQHGNTPTQKVTASPKRSHRKSMPSDPKHTPARHERHSPPLKPISHPRAPADKGRRSLRGGEVNLIEEVSSPPLKHDELLGESPKAKLSRIKLRVKPTSLPLTHPGLVLRRPRLYPTLPEYFEKARHLPVEDGGLYSVEDGSEYTHESVLKDAELLVRLEEAAEPGGLLSEGLCQAYELPEADPIPQQYAHRDHLNRAVTEFKKLMKVEQRKHKATAKRLAEACREEWLRKQPKSTEQLEAEEMRAGENRYKNLVKILQATWGNAKAEVNRRRLVEWNAQEKERVRKALNEAVDNSTLKLQAQGVYNRDSEMTSEDDDTGSSDDDNDEEGLDSADDDRESNMTSEDSEGEEELVAPDAVEDENLTQEQLREKYAGLRSNGRDGACRKARTRRYFG
jgi:helicase SWR1